MAIVHPASFALCLLVPAVSAQRTWTVDAANGPGTDFTTLQAAFNGANDGDTLIVRAGLYAQSGTQKGFRVLGQGRPQIVQLNVLVNQPSSRFVLSACDIISTVQLHSCVGLVHFEDVTSPTNLSLSGCRLIVTDCVGVTLQRCRFRGQGGSPGVLITRSTVLITGSDISGAGASSSAVFPAAAQPAVWPRSGTLAIAGGTLRGGDGAVGNTVFAPAEAIRVDAADVTLGGDATTTVQAGFLTGRAAAAITSQGGTLLLDPSVTLVPTGGAPPITGPIAVTSRRHPALGGQGAAPGNAAAVTAFAPAGRVAVLFGSATAAPLSLPGLGLVWLDAGTLTMFATGVVGPTEHWTVNVPVPPGLAPGLPWTFQALTVAGASLWDASNGLVLVLN